MKKSKKRDISTAQRMTRFTVLPLIGGLLGGMLLAFLAGVYDGYTDEEGPFARPFSHGNACTRYVNDGVGGIPLL